MEGDDRPAARYLVNVEQGESLIIVSISPRPCPPTVSAIQGSGESRGLRWNSSQGGGWKSCASPSSPKPSASNEERSFPGSKDGFQSAWVTESGCFERFSSKAEGLDCGEHRRFSLRVRSSIWFVSDCTPEGFLLFSAPARTRRHPRRKLPGTLKSCNSKQQRTILTTSSISPRPCLQTVSPTPARGDSRSLPGRTPCSSGLWRWGRSRCSRWCSPPRT